MRIARVLTFAAAVSATACAPDVSQLTPREQQVLAYCNYQSAMAETGTRSLSSQIVAGQSARQACINFFLQTGRLPNEPAR